MRNAVVSAEFAEQADKMRSIIATNFSDMLEENRWSRRAAAEALGLTHTYVNSRATGDVEMSGSDIMLFASFLGVSEAEFFAANRPKPKSNVRILNTAKNAGKLRNDNSHRPVVSLADWKRSA
ncbi:helix-turn-helix domain-containing protein [Humibacter sp.]|uniref:helix-turn-helix domain-containing protein n=1 Tax=Humibacter sp. TaxID=1940291 RepID=UPI003F7F2182